jgi:RHS repeat-associated protein
MPARSLKTKTRYYFGSNCEREVVAGVTTQYIWIGGDAYTALAVAKKVGTGAWTVYNIFRDHLGTITHLKNASNIDEYSFDAWGRRRDKDDWTTTLTSEPTLFADRGFTGHEYLEDFKLYNMNGRLYDPVVGRFLNADPFVQDPSNTQSYNRYSYCLNNPLKFNDPSGELPVWMLWPISWAGNFIIGGLDRWINGKQPFNQAFSVTKNPVVFSANYSPSTNTFSNYQVDAYNAVVNQERVWKNLGEFVASQRGTGYKDVTSDFNNQLDKTMAYFTISRGFFDIDNPKNGLGKEIDKLMFFRSKVTDNAVFDIKKTSFSREKLGDEYGLYRDHRFRYDDFGNYNYGVAARSFGLSLDIALFGAGMNQISKFNPDFFNPGGYFDHRQDTEMIIKGYNHKW